MLQGHHRPVASSTLVSTGHATPIRIQSRKARLLIEPPLEAIMLLTLCVRYEEGTLSDKCAMP